MEIDIIEEAKQFLKQYLGERNCSYETIHPWRKDTRYVILHSMRVYSYVLEIIESERDNLKEDEILLIKLAAVLHDIGKSEGKKGHAAKSVEVVKEWLKNNPLLGNEIKDLDRLYKVIANHSNKGVFDEDLCSSILKDADILDEIGILSIFMTSNWLDRQSPFFFNELVNRVEGFEIGYAEEQMTKLYTQHSKKILKEKIGFIKGFIKQLRSEIKETEDLYNAL